MHSKIVCTGLYLLNILKDHHDTHFFLFKLRWGKCNTSLCGNSEGSHCPVSKCTFWLENTINFKVFINYFVNQSWILLFYWNKACTKIEEMLGIFGYLTEILWSYVYILHLYQLAVSVPLETGVKIWFCVIRWNSWINGWLITYVEQRSGCI